MAINKALQLKKVKVMWEGEEAAEVRGLVPADIAAIMAEAGERVHDILAALEEHDFHKASGSVEDVADRLLAELPKTIAKISHSVPEFVALVIAYAADDKDNVDHIRDNWVIPLQFEALAEVARLTFVNDEGFRKFVGNVVALLQSGNTLTGGASNSVKKQAKTRTARGPVRSATG